MMDPRRTNPKGATDGHERPCPRERVHSFKNSEPEPGSESPATAQAAAADGSLAEFFSPWYDQLRADLDILGVGEVDDLQELEAEEIEKLVGKLKAVQARKLRKKLASVGAGAEQQAPQ